MQQILSDLQTETINIIMQDVESQVVFCKLSIVCSFCTLYNHRLPMEAGTWSNSYKYKNPLKSTTQLFFETNQHRQDLTVLCISLLSIL